ncbi:hypothetical protein TNCV_4327331 [Trichonephila clavipes]|nr:hypothetical protein TNCV_4327331 [Trichonephila clavipes]
MSKRQSCPVKSLNLATVAARGELGIPWDFLHSVLQGLSRATREANPMALGIKLVFLNINKGYCRIRWKIQRSESIQHGDDDGSGTL